VTQSFEHLREFIRKRMRMSHIYQPVMIKELLMRGGNASIRNIAAAFLPRDVSQLEYYEQITKNMPGKVLGKHGIVAREKDGYRLTVDPTCLSLEQTEELVQPCDEAIEAYLLKRGAAVYDHRRAALGYLSGSLRYEVLKRAGFRCELCGISADERAIEVDHIIPRKHGGTDDLTNLQALCFKCNANKGARDDARQTDCIFCELLPDRVLASNALSLAIEDNYPVTRFHTLIIPKRHTTSFFDLFEPERRAINQLLDELRKEIAEKDVAVTGFNIGVNIGDAAGQTCCPCSCALDPASQRRCRRPERRRESRTTRKGYLLNVLLVVVRQPKTACLADQPNQPAP
jgi:ATP adenylyltransferase